MTHEARIKTAFERQARAVELKPSLGQYTVVSKVRVREGLACEIEEGPWKLTADLKKAGGGQDEGPTPGVLGRAAFGSCLAMGYILWAAKLGVPISDLAVHVETDVDERGRYGLADLPAGYRQVRYTVKVQSTAPEADVLRVIEMADAHSPYFDVFNRALDLKRKVEITAPEK